MASNRRGHFMTLFAKGRIAALCLSVIPLLAVQHKAVAAVTKKECKVSPTAVKAVESALGKEKKKLSYDFELTAPSGKHFLAITSCSPSLAGAPAKGQTFTLYDLNGGDLVGGDTVVIKGPQGLLLGLNVNFTKNELRADKIKITAAEKFILQRTDKKKVKIKAGDKITLSQPGSKYLMAKGGGGQEIISGGSKKAAFTVSKLANTRLSKAAPAIPAVTAVKEKDLGKCNAAKKSVDVKGTAYDFELTAPSLKHQLAITSCKGKSVKVGAAKTGQTFTLYDVNGGDLKNNDKVFIKGPHGLLLGLSRKGDLIASRSAATLAEQFTVKKTAKKSKPLVKGDTITLTAKGGKILTALGSGGQKIVGKGTKVGKTEKFKVKTLTLQSAPVIAVNKQDPGKCKASKEIKVGGSAYKFQLNAPNGKDGLSLVTCAWVGAPDGEGQTFTLFDLNEKTLKDGDKVVIKAPHGYLLGLDKGELKANRKSLGRTEKFTVKKTGKNKNKPVNTGDTIALLASDGTYITALGKGGSKVVADGRKKIGANEKFKIRKLALPVVAQKVDPKKCKASKKIKVGGNAYNLELTTVGGDHGLSLTTCAWVGMTKGEGQTFTLYDLNKGELKFGDTVAIKAPHGYLLGADKKGKLVADKKTLTKMQKFTVKRVGKKAAGKGFKTVLQGDKIAFMANGKSYFTSAMAGGGRVTLDKKKKIAADETFMVKGLRKINEVAEDYAKTCTGKGSSALKKKNKKAVKVPGLGYEIRLQEFKKKVSIAGTSCLEVGMGDMSSMFTLYDLNGGNLVHDDQVVFRGPNKLLLGFDEKDVFKAERSKYATREVFRVRKVNANGQPLAGKIGRNIKNGDLIALLTHDGRYLGSDGKILKSSKNLAALKGKVAPPRSNEMFTVGSLIKERDKPSYKKLAKTAVKKLAATAATATGKLLANAVISGIMGQAVGDKLVPLNASSKGKSASGGGTRKKSKITFGPEACLKNSSLVMIPLEDDEVRDNTAKQRANKKTKKGPATGAKKVLQKLMAKLDKLQSCGGLNFTLPIPKTDLIMKAFSTRVPGRELPLWNIALIAGPKTLNDNPLANIPALKKITGGLKIDRLLAIVSEDQAKVSFKDLGKDIKKVLKDYQQTTSVSDKFGNTRKTGGFVTDQDGVVLQQGVNLFGSFKLTSGKGLGAMSELILPGSTKSKEPWRFSAIVGMPFIQKLMNKVSNFEKVEAEEYTNKTALKLEMWLPSYTPFPFNLINNKKIFHAEVTKARFVFDLSKNKDKGGKVNPGLGLTAQTWNNYYVLGSSAFPIMGKGEFNFRKGAVSGKFEGAYEVKASQDPLGKLIPGVNLTKLMIGGGIAQNTKGGKKTKTLTFQMGSQLSAGKEAITSTFDIIIEKEGASKVKLKEFRISLSGEGEDGKIEIGKMGALGKIPLANELVLEKGIIGITPKKNGTPDFYITGGVTWTRTNMGGKIAIMKTTPKGKSKEELFIFVTQNDFSLANLLPNKKSMEVPKALLTLMKMPQTMIMFNTVKGDDVELAVTDFPAPLQSMFEGFIAGMGDDAVVPIKGDSLSIITALDFSAKERSVMTDGFEKIGLSKFGPTGPLIATGSIGGLKSGQLTIGIAAKLPGFAFPDKVFGKTNPIAQIIKPQGVDFFVDVVVKGAPRVEVGLKGKMRLDLPRLDNFAKKDRQDLTGKIFVKAAATGDIGIFVAGDKAGTWQDPLGLNKNIGIKNPAVMIGIIVSANAAANINIGIGGTIVFKIKDKDGKTQTLEYDGDLFVGGGVSAIPTYVVPNKFGLNLGASKISIDTTIRVADAIFDGMLQGGLINVIIDGDPNNPLAPGLPNGAVKDGINKLRNGLAKVSLPELLMIDKIPLPGLVLKPASGNDKVRIYFATPGVYIPGREKTMNGLGFSVTGAASIDLLGKNYPIGEVDVTLSAMNGLRVYGQIAPINIGALKLGAGKSKQNPAGGTALDVKASIDETYIMLNGRVQLLPIIDDETRIKLSTTDTSFYIKKSIGGDLFNIELDINSSSDAANPKFTVDATIDNGINKVVESLFTTLGIPDPAIKKIMSVNPVVIESFRLKSDLMGFAKGTGDPIEVKIKPIYFGEPRPLIEANIKAIDWKNPANILLNGQELPNAILGSLIDYMIDHPEKAIKLPDIDLGVMAVKDGFFGGAKRAQSYANYVADMKLRKKPRPSKSQWKSKKPEEGVFLLNAKTELLGAKSGIRLEITPGDIAFKSDVSLLGGALKSKITGQGKVKDRIVTDMTFRGEFTSGIDAFVTDTIMPGLGIPKPVIDGLKGATPMLIRKVAFAGELAGIITGNSPVTVYLDPVFFGDEKWAKKRRTVSAVLPKLDINNPAKSLLAGPQVIAALSKAMVEYLIDNPKKLPALDLGIMKIDESVLGGVEVMGFSKKGKKEKVFQIKGGLASFLSKPKADMRFGQNYMEMNFSDKLLGGIIQSKYTMSGDIKSGSLNMHGAVTADFGKWFKVNGLGAVTKEFDKLNPGFAKARKDLETAMAKIVKLDKDIAAKREVVKKERARAASPLISAEAEVAKLQSQVVSLNGLLNRNKSKIGSCKQKKSVCILRKPYRSGWKIKTKCVKRISVPNLPARAVCEAKNTPYRVKVASAAVRLASVVSAKAVAGKTLESIRKGITDFPIDLDPRVSVLITARVAATAAVKAAQIAVEGANIANKLLPLGLKAIGRGDAFIFEKGDFYGRFPEVVKGEPMVFDLKYTMMGKPMNDRMAFSSTDAAFNSRQMEVIALGIAVDTIIKEGKKSKVIPHALLNMVENIYNKKKAAADEELNKVIGLNPLIPAIGKGTQSFSASLLADSDKRNTGAKQAIKRKAAIKVRIQKAKEKARFKRLAVARVNGLQSQLAKARKPRMKGVRIVMPDPRKIRTLAAQLKAARAELVKLGGKVKAAPPPKKTSRPVNLAKGRKASQSSVAAGGVPQRAVDGNKNGNFRNKSVTHTKDQVRPWWQVDLGGRFQIDTIRLYNRTDCCGQRLNNAVVMVSDKPFRGNPLKARRGDGIRRTSIGRSRASHTIKVGRTGRYVRIQLPGKAPLSLAEVEVIGRR